LTSAAIRWCPVNRALLEWFAMPVASTSNSGAAVRSSAAARGRGDRQHLAGGTVRRIFLPAHRSERPFQHAADAHRVGPKMKIHGALMQCALRLRRAIALAQIIEPGRAMIALGPEFGIGDVARDRPAIGTVALAAELHFLHHIVEGA